MVTQLFMVYITSKMLQKVAGQRDSKNKGEKNEPETLTMNF